MDEIDQRIQQLEDIHSSFQIISGANVTVEGSLKNGFAICATCPDTGGATSGGVIPPTPPPPATGACCEEDGTCSIQTAPGCAILGGIYQGDETTCFPNPCPQPPEETGACCVGTNCSIETEEDCAGMGGVYQGDDTTCDPNPCEEEPCLCGGFLNPDDGLYYNRIDYINSVDNSMCPANMACSCEEHSTQEFPCSIEGSYAFESEYPSSYLASKTFNEACEEVEDFEEISTGFYCCCFEGCTGIPDNVCEDYTPGRCPPCEGGVIPEIWTLCGVLTTEEVYSEPCIP